MARFAYLILVLLLAGCAQVGTLSGGPEDTNAPQLQKADPPSESVRFQKQEVTLLFDEYVTLQSPSQTIVVLPPDMRVLASSVGKEVRLFWDDTLQENTTYVINLNGTVKDFTAGNDTLIQYVFSTGDFIDSLSYEVQVVDAFTNEPVKDVTLGLYSETADSIKPVYFARSDASGKAAIRYIKAGNYFVRAFEDANKDLLVQRSELSGFKDELITLPPSISDTIPVRLSREIPRKKIRSFTYRAPGQFIIGATGDLDSAQIRFNGQVLKSDELLFHARDSVSVFRSVRDLSVVKIDVEATDWADSVQLRIENAQKQQKITVENNLYNSTLLPNESLQVMLSDRFAEVDKDQIRIFNNEDSTFREIDSVTYNGNRMHIYFDRTELRDVELRLSNEAYRTENREQSDSLRLNFTVKSEREFGTVKLDASLFKEPIVLDVLLDNKRVRSIPLIETDEVILPNLEPGMYTFRVIRDVNQNGRWDPGSFTLRRQPEAVVYFPKPVKVRANWEIEVILE